jgi:hypothetical protein
MSLPPAQRETTVSFSDDGDDAQVRSAQRSVIARLKKNPAAVLVEEGTDHGSPWARFTFPAALVTFRKPVVMTDEQRQAARDRARANFTREARDGDEALGGQPVTAARERKARKARRAAIIAQAHG